MVNWLIDNEGKELGDEYGRQWKWENYEFCFKDIAYNAEWRTDINCWHLFGTNIKEVSYE